jgi:hypothetical protein
MRWTIAFALLLIALPVMGQDLPRPRPEPGAETIAPLPRPRPDRDAAQPASAPVAVPEKNPAENKPPRIFQTACPAVIAGLVEAKPLPPISEGACGERSPLSVTGVLVSGRMVPLSGEAILNCEMAQSLPGWAEAVDGYAGSMANAGLASISVGTSYMCRERRTGEAGTDLSEHAFANGLDVTGFTLTDGQELSVESGWASLDAVVSRIVRFAHDAACTRFTTVLGPEANALHSDHLHLDMGCHGKSCQARLCQ